MGKGTQIKLTIVVPTIGRITLKRLLESLIYSGISSTDEVLLLADDGPKEMEIPTSYSWLPIRVERVGARRNDWGMHARNLSPQLAHGTHHGFIDDDDMYLDGSLLEVKKILPLAPDLVHLFRVRICPGGHLVWNDQAVRVGNVSTQCVFVPAQGPRGKWAPEYAGDHKFIESTIAARGGESPVWSDKIIAELYPSWSRPGG